MGCVFQAIIALFFVWFVAVNPEILSGVVSAISEALELIRIIITQIINAIL